MPRQITKETNEFVSDKTKLHDKVLVVRGQKVILDYELAKIFGRSEKDFRAKIVRIVKNCDDQTLLFKLLKEDLDSVFLKESVLAKYHVKTKSNAALPYAFTKQGIAMLKMLLNGEIAIKPNQDLALIFKKIESLLHESRGFGQTQDGLQPTTSNTYKINSIDVIKLRLDELEKRVGTIEDRNKNLSLPNDPSSFYANYKDTLMKLETVFFGGEPMRASKAYMDIYHSAKKTIYILDNYASIKTLWHLDGIKPGVKVIIFSDNIENTLHNVDFVDFKKERPNTDIRLVRTMGKLHDRFIVIDAGEDSEAIYHCGTSEKDAGHKIAAISKLKDEIIKNAVRRIVDGMLSNKTLRLK